MLNVAREAFGLLGITVLGAVLTSKQTSALAAGAEPSAAFISGYRLALLLAAIIIAAGVPISLHVLRRPAGRRVRPESATEILPMPAPAPSK